MDFMPIAVSPSPSTVVSVDRACRTPPAPASRRIVDPLRVCMTPETSTVNAFRSITPASSFNCWTPGHESECTDACTDADHDIIRADCDSVPVAIAPVLSELLERLAESTEQTPSVFCAFPAMGLHDFVTRCAKYSNFTMAPFVAAVMLIDRLDAKGFSHLIGQNSVQLVFLTALCVAAKAVEEYQLANSMMAAIGGITTAHLKVCEMELITALDWELGINEDAFSEYMDFLISKAGVSAERVGHVGFLGH